jgi:hypothetical protein
MAGRTRRYTVGSPEAGHDILTISWTAGASGAVSAINPTTRAKGFRKTTPIVRNSAGNYDVFFDEKWIDLMWYSINCNGPISATDGKYGDVVSDALTAAAPKITLQMKREDTGAAADPASGDQVYFTFGLKRWSPL